MSETKVENKSVYVWLDNQLMRSEDYIDVQDQLRTMHKSFRCFKDSDECIDFITDLTDCKIFLITSNILGKILVPLVHLWREIDTIIIFYSNKQSDVAWTTEYRQIKGVFKDMKLICQHLNLKQCSDPIPRSKEDKDLVPISFLSSGDVTSRDLNRQDPSFMYFQLLKEILLHDHHAETDEQTKTDMLNFCRKTYPNNPHTLEIIEQFEENFIPELAISWYTRECFLYQMLNKALWTPQPDVLYKLRYFLRHLYRQISKEAVLQRQHLSSMIVYRGQTVSEQQLEKLKKNIGGFLSFNNFLSTSFNENIARHFLWGSEVGVLFEMHIDPSIAKFPFVNIEQISYLQKEYGEQELLFAMGTVFRIVRIDQVDNEYRVQLTLSDEVDQQLAKYTKRTREDTQTSHSFLSLLRLMNELGQYGSIDRFATMLAEDAALSINPSLLAAIHHIFGSIYLARGQSDEALNHLNKSLAIYLNYLPPNHPTLTPTYNNIGSVYIARSDYDRGLEFQQLALDCQTNSDHPDLSSIITYTNNIAKLYAHQEKYTKALECHKRALELQEQYLGGNDLSLTETYNTISTLCFKLGDYEQAITFQEKAIQLQANASEANPEAADASSMTTGSFCLAQGQYQEALEHFNRALQSQQQYLLPNNPTLATTHNRIASSYYKQERFEEALPHYTKALEIEQNALSSDHPSIATSYFNISTAYVGLLRWSEALEYALKAVELLKQTLQTDVNTLAAFVHHIGHIYQKQDQAAKALVYYEEALQLYRAHLSEDDPSLASVYHRTASAYYNLGRYRESLPLYQKTLEIELRTLPHDAETIAVTYSNLSTAYLGLKQFDEALLAATLAHDQLRKTLSHNHPDVVQQRVYLDIVKQRHISEGP